MGPFRFWPENVTHLCRGDTVPSFHCPKVGSSDSIIYKEKIEKENNAFSDRYWREPTSEMPVRDALFHFIKRFLFSELFASYYSLYTARQVFLFSLSWGVLKNQFHRDLFGLNLNFPLLTFWDTVVRAENYHYTSRWSFIKRTIRFVSTFPNRFVEMSYKAFKNGLKIILK